MQTRRSVVLNGDLGSGKTTVSTLLAQRLGIRRISIGDLYRRMAAQRGMTALQLNLHAELDDKIDHYIDQLQGDVAASGEQLIVDSRLAWHFFTDGLKVHMIADPTVAAQRVLARPADNVESYTSVEEARTRLASRSESERMRFLTRYGVDKTRLRNYDLVCDSTNATPEQIVERIVTRLAAPPTDIQPPICYLDPRRIYPTADPPTPEDTAAGERTTVGYSAPYFYAVDGHRRISSAVREGRTLLAATLAAEAGEPIAGQTSDEYFAAHVNPARTRAWEDAHGITLPAVEPRLQPASSTER
jgi:predicted cytidylate kinase